MSNVSDIETSAPLAKALLSRYDRLDVDSLVTLDGLIALSQIYQYRSEYAAITADSDCVAEASFCGRRISAVADRISQLYHTLRDTTSCVRALEHLRVLEYGCSLDHLKLFVDRQTEVLLRPMHLTDADRLMLAIISGDDDDRLVRFAEVCSGRNLDVASARALLTAAAIVPDRIRLDVATEWFENEVGRLMRLQPSSLSAGDLQLIGLAPLIWNSLPSMRHAVESLATLNPRADLTADMTIAAHRAFLALTSLIASITAA
jgi:hypothetical protein